MTKRNVSLPAGIVEPDGRVTAAAAVAFLEGPAADAEGNVFFSDIYNNRILCLRADGKVEVFRADSGRANGNVFDLEGRLVTCEGAEMGPGGRRRVTRTDMKTGEVTVLVDRFEGKRLNSPNDVVPDTKGNLYFTDPCYGDRSIMEMDIEGVYMIRLDGSVKRIMAQPHIGRPNGIAISPDDRTLYLIDAHPVVGGNRKVWAFDLGADGELTNQRVVFDFAPGRGGDGMEVDRAGNLYVCAGLHQPRGPHETDLNPCGVYVITPDGQLLGMIPIPEDVITNCCFGGPDMKTLYVAAGKTLFSIRVNQPGYHVYPRHA
ncbi:MAG: SMP-30/gluconolactonase/LRE family protein [Gammaproteobacteria bacterium]